MKKQSNFSFLLIAALVVATILSCKRDPLAKYGEQYKKTLYIVHADQLTHIKNHFYENTDDTVYISVYCGSSEPITEDVEATLRFDGQALDSVNRLISLENANDVPKQLLPTHLYTFSESVVKIKAGEQFGLLKIPVQLADIDPDIEYTIPVSLVSNNAGFDINPRLRSIVYQPNMVNNYSGVYSGSSKEADETSPQPITPTLTALSKDRLRLPIHNLDDDMDLLATNYMVLTIAEDRETVSISAFRDASIVEGTGHYDEGSKTFELTYSYLVNGELKTVDAQITNVQLIEGEE